MEGITNGTKKKACDKSSNGGGFANTRSAVEAEITAAAKSDPTSHTALSQEARLAFDENVLLVFGPECPLGNLGDTFFGSVIMVNTPFTRVCASVLTGKTVYLCGDISWARSDEMKASLSAKREAFIINKISTDIGTNPEWDFVEIGRVPICVQGVGVLYPQFFDMRDLPDAFEQVRQDHTFQPAAESSPVAAAPPTTDADSPTTGVSLTPVARDEKGNLVFRLLRNSISFAGPTENFKATDHQIVESLNLEATRIFDKPAPLNHVVAQIYWDKQSTPSSEKMASDKTKDMPTNGIVAFSTFYDRLGEPLERNNEKDPFDWVKEGSKSGLTRMRFQLKDQVKQRGSPLVGRFDVTLYPNSVFFMPLSTNRLYTHEICPSSLSSKHLPTRMGYVVRCSATEAVHKEGKTFIQKPGSKKKRNREQMEWEQMQEPTEAGVKRLKRLYQEEDESEKYIDYGGKFLFSMNNGDYRKPNYDIRDEFPVFALDPPTNLFPHLLPTVAFEEISPGRRAAVLVHASEYGTPIVRSTTKMKAPAQIFQPFHHGLAGDIVKAASLNMPLNNTRVELFNNQYAEMVFHSEQCQDLAKGSHIVLFSCYENPNVISRKLVVESKIPGEGGFEIPLAQNSVVVWSLETNSRFRHKIVLDKSQGDPQENVWMGFTFRTSGTIIQYQQEEGDSSPRGYFIDSGMPLVLLDGDLAVSPIYKLRKMENAATEFKYPDCLNSTISPSDLKPPIDGTKKPVPRSRSRERRDGLGVSNE